MQKSLSTAYSYLWGRGAINQLRVSLGEGFRVIDQRTFSTTPSEAAQAPGGAGKASGSSPKPIAVTLTWTSGVSATKNISKAKPAPSPSPTVAVSAIKKRQPPYILKAKAEAAARMQQKAKEAAVRKRADLIAKKLAAKAKVRTVKGAVHLCSHGWIWLMLKPRAGSEPQQHRHGLPDHLYHVQHSASCNSGYCTQKGVYCER